MNALMDDHELIHDEMYTSRLLRDRYLQMVDWCTRVRQLQLDDKGIAMLGGRYLQTMDLCNGVR